MGGVLFGKLTWYTSLGASNPYGTMKASGGRLRALVASNRNAAARYVLLFDQASGAPSGTTNLIATFPLPVGGTNLSTLFVDQGPPFVNGITWAISTAGTTYTAATGTEHDVTAVYQ